MLSCLALSLFQGLVIPAVHEEPNDGPWRLQHGRVQAQIEDGFIIEAIQRPVLTRGNVELRASMALFWLNASALDQHTPGLPVATKESGPQDILDTFGQNPESRILSEVYFEGPIEYFVDGEHVGSASGFYLNLNEEHGWIADAEILLQREVRDRDVTWSARAEWMERTPEGTLRSDHAVLTPCTLVDQHIAVQTRGLEVVRGNPGDARSFKVSLRGNSLGAYGLLKMPLPPFVWDADEEGAPLLPELKLGSSSRFGTFVETGLSFNADDVGKGVHQILGGGDVKADSDGHVRLSWLGSRGVLLDLSMELEAKDKYDWDMAIGGLFDTARDRGLIRVDKSKRSELRTWVRSRGRFLRDEKNWLDLAISTESDAAVQSEFFEHSYIRYEQRENYLNWRSSVGSRFFSTRLKLQVDSNRSQIEELPSARLTYSRRPIPKLSLLGSGPLIYSSDSSLTWSRRVEGDSTDQSPFGLQAPFSDGLGDRHRLRADSTQLFELPIQLGSGWKFTPFLRAQATAWDKNTLETARPVRFGVDAGARLTTTFWKRFSSTTIVQVSPYLETRHNLLDKLDGGDPVVFDALDLISGVDSQALGLRTRVFGWKDAEEFDMEVIARRREVHGTEDLMTLEVFAGLKSQLLNTPVSFSHAARYDLDRGASLISRSVVGLRPTEALGLEFSHARALDELNAPHYEAATMRALYRWTEKWELEGSQTISVLSDTDLTHEAVLRRYGHDLVFEFGISQVSGEGGTTFTMKARPKILFKRSRIGLTNHR